MAANVTHTLKVHVGDEIRRFVVSFPAGATPTQQYEAFNAKVAEVFPEENFTFKWKDADGDLITVGSAYDFSEALTELDGGGPIRFQAVIPRSKSESAAPTPTLSREPSGAPENPVPPSPPTPPPKPEPVAHPNVICDGTNEPLHGTRYHKIGANFDLCETEFAKIPESDKQQYEIILFPRARPIPYEPVIHYGVTCDATNNGPIIGCRFHKIGNNYDLCQVEFSKLDEEEKRNYELIVHPRSNPVPYARPEPESGTDSESDAEVPEFIKMLEGVLSSGVIDGTFFTNLGRGCKPGGRCGPRHPHHKHREEHPSRGPHRHRHHHHHHHRGHHHPHQRQEVSAANVLPTGTFGGGSYGEGVEQLQHILIQTGLMDPSAIAWKAGMFGPRTRRAIADFQRTNNLQVDVIGRYDDITRDALLALLNVTTQGDVQTDLDVKAANVPTQNSGSPSIPTTEQTETAGNDIPNNITNGNINGDSTDAANPSAEPEPSAPPEHPTAPSETGHWEPEIQSLKQMGFTNEQLLREILDRKEGSVVETVSEMLRLASA